MLTKNIPEFIRIAQEHAAAGRFIGGRYVADDGKTCFIGCYAGGENNPDAITDAFGLSAPMIRLAEEIFERLPNNAARNNFGPAIGLAVAVDGKDLSLVIPAFMVRMLSRLPGANQPHIANVIALYRRVLGGVDIRALQQEFSDAAADAHAAAHAAAAAHLAAAVDAARAAHAAAAAHLAAETEIQRSDFLKLLATAPVVQGA
jgi:hypothetical protein